MMSARGFRVIKPWRSGLGVKAWSVIGTSLAAVDCCLRPRRDLVLRLARVMKTPYNNHGRSDAGGRDAVDRIHNVRFRSIHGIQSIGANVRFLSLSGHASGHSSRSACDGGCQIRFSSVCANATARSSGMRPITRRLRPPRDHQASDRLSRRSERIGASGASLAMMQSKTGSPEGST